MRMKDFETAVSAPCLNMMEGKDLSGVSSPITDIKYSPNHTDGVTSNGILSPPTTPSATTPVDNEYGSSTTGSGRFKFFKDGKFILELWHHKNGERMYWIPVSKNSTYWPAAGNCTSRQESSTSLSVSDDNLSIQSSPWQRDHIWKQNTPRKNINREMEFSSRVLRHLRKKYYSSYCIRKKRRRPYDPVKLEKFNLDSNSSKNSCHGGSKKNDSSNHNRILKLPEIIQLLWERKSLNENTIVNLCRTDPGIVSPRKRILKEMEKVTLEEFGNTNKKYRARVALTCNSPITTTTSAIPIPMKPATATSRHSINSILAKDEEPSFLRNLLRSPSNDNSSHESSSRSTFGNDSPSSDIRITSLNNLHSSTPVTSSPPSYSSSRIPCPHPIQAYHLPLPYIYHQTPPYLSPPPPIPSNHPPYYSVLPSNYHSSSAIWGFRTISSLPRPSVYPVSTVSSYPPSLNAAPWIPLAHHTSFQNYTAGADNDVPLNLTKNGY